MYCVFFLNVFLYQMLLLLLLVASCAAIPQNVSEKMFTFPQETNTAHVRLTTSRQNLQAVTVCFRFFTDLTREYALFSLAVPSFDNGLLFYKNLNSFSVSVKNAEPIFEGLDFKLNKWHSVCGTWSAASGLVQLWLNGEPSSRKLSSTSNINGPIIIALGQVLGNINLCERHIEWNYINNKLMQLKKMGSVGSSEGQCPGWFEWVY
uniref:Pentraxin family member n=1 Tax=Xiphophorus couchianus TaxID=32473 RepID=A0A3B5MPQ2_9TELE